MITKTSVDSGYAVNVVERVQRHIDNLDEDVEELKNDIDKLDGQHEKNTHELKKCEEEAEGIKYRMSQALEILEGEWKSADGNKTRMRNLLRKQHGIDKERFSKQQKLQKAQITVDSLKQLFPSPLHGVKRPSSTPSSSGTPSKQAKVSGAKARSSSELSASSNKLSSLPSFKKASSASHRAGSVDSEHGVKPDPAVKNEDSKGKVKKEVTPVKEEVKVAKEAKTPLESVVKKPASVGK